MIAQMRSEWIKLRSVRSTVVLFAITVALCLVVGVLSGTLSKGTLYADDALGGVQVAVLLVLVLGVQIIGQEYRFSTIRPTFSATPRRGRVILAKAFVLMLATVATAVVLIVLSLVTTEIAVHLHGIRLDLGAPGTGRVVVGTVVLLVVASLIGFGVGCIVRQPIAGIVIVLVWVTMLEPILAGLVPKAWRWLPIAGMANVNALVLHGGTGPDDVHVFGPVAAALYSAAVGCALVALGWWRIRSSDA